MAGQLSLACDVNVSVLSPDGATLAPPTCMEGSGFIDVRTLPLTGTYTIVLDPIQWAIGSVTITLHEVPADTTGVISIGESPLPVLLETPGQNGILTFTGTAATPSR